MLTQEEHVEAVALAARGWTVSAIAKHLDRDRKTIRSYLTGQTAPGVRRRTSDPFALVEPYVRQRLKDDPHLQLAVLIRELGPLGFSASYQTLTREVRHRSLRPHCEACAGAKGRATTDIEHPGGAETQWDWLELPDPPWARKLIVLTGTLAHSSKTRAWVSEAKDTPHLLQGIDAVLSRLGGLTKAFRIDAMEGAVVPGTRNLCAAFADAARYYGVSVAVCPPRRGNRKGVVEKNNDHVAQSWWRTADVATPEQAQVSLDAFCETVGDARPRGDATVGVLADREPLRPIPPGPYPAVVESPRKVSWAALVSYEGNRYSVPAAFVNAWVTVSVRLGHPIVEIRSGEGEVLAQHRRRPAGAGALARSEEHRAGLERTVLAQFSTQRPCRRKEHRPPSDEARAIAAKLTRGVQQSFDVDLASYEELMAP
jgi:transposase